MKRSPAFSLPFARWPEADRRLWAARMEAGSLFDDDRPGAALSEGARRGRRYAYSSFLGYVAHHGPTRLSLSPLQRVDRDLIAAYVTFLRETRGEIAISIDLERIYYVLRSFGGVDIAWLRMVGHRVRRNARPKPRPFVTSDQLYQLGLDLMDHAAGETGANGSILDRQAKMYRDGLMIALLAAIPIRRRAFAAMRIGRHLVRVGDRWALVVPECDSKTGRAFEYEVGQELSARVDTYLARYRPTITGAERHDGVWASRHGHPMAANTILQSITRRTVERFGHAVSPHRFRGAAATFWSIADPENVRGAKDLLGHTTFAMTEKYYMQAQSRSAELAFAAMIDGLRSAHEDLGHNAAAI